MQQDVVVTGMGIAASIGNNGDEFAASLRSGRCGITRLSKKHEPPISVGLGAELPDFSLQERLQEYGDAGALSEEFIRNILICAFDAPRGVQVSVLCVLEAWLRAGLREQPVAPERLAVVVSGSNLVQDYHYALLPKFRENPRYLNPKYAIRWMDTDHVGTLSEIFSARGEGFTVGGASASGNLAIIKARQSLQLGLVDACLVVGALADLSPLELQGFYNVGAMGGKKFKDQPGKACRPFDKEHEGFIYGQAGACLVLESAASAQKRQVPILAELVGGALVLDGNRLSNPSEDGEVRAMTSALAQAGLPPTGVDLISAHGTSSPLGDQTEVAALKRVFKEDISKPWINATKGLTGHCLTAAGVVEAAAAIIQLRDGFVHANLNLESPIDRECRFAGAEAVPAQVNVVLSNSFGFGGINTSVVLKKGGS